VACPRCNGALTRDAAFATLSTTGYQTTHNAEQHVNFIAADGRVYELFL
jgi:hypothetical protein